MSDDGQSFIKSPRQLITVIVLAFVVPVIVMVAIANWTNQTMRTGTGADAMTPEAVAQRLAPVGRLVVAGSAEAAAEVESTKKAAAEQMTKVAAAAQAAAPAASVGAGSAAQPATTEAAAAQPAADGAASAAAPAAAGGATADLAAGEKIYNGTCGVCHNSGVAGAPKHGDAKAWKPRLAQGVDVLDKHAIEGIRAMPPRGGNGKLTDDDLRNAVAYMIDSVK